MKYDDIVWPLEYTLESPVTLTRKKGGHETTEEISELTIREPTLGDIGDIKLGEPVALSKVWKVGERLCGQREIVLKKLTGEDAALLVTVVFGFFAKCQSGLSED